MTEWVNSAAGGAAAAFVSLICRSVELFQNIIELCAIGSTKSSVVRSSHPLSLRHLFVRFTVISSFSSFLSRVRGSFVSWPWVCGVLAVCVARSSHVFALRKILSIFGWWMKSLFIKLLFIFTACPTKPVRSGIFPFFRSYRSVCLPIRVTFEPKKRKTIILVWTNFFPYEYVHKIIKQIRYGGPSMFQTINFFGRRRELFPQVVGLVSFCFSVRSTIHCYRLLVPPPLGRLLPFTV